MWEESRRHLELQLVSQENREWYSNAAQSWIAPPAGCHIVGGRVYENCLHAGNVLLPIDAAGRVLEVLLLLDMHWEKAKLYFTLVFMAPQARQVLESAKTQLTWMSDGVLQAFERSRDNPFALRYTLRLTLQLTLPCMLTPTLARYPCC